MNLLWEKRSAIVTAFAAESRVQYRHVNIASAVVSGVLDSRHGNCVTGIVIISA